MNNTELMAMEYLPEPNNGKRDKSRLRLKLRDIPLRMLGFLLAGAMPISGLAPFGLSFLTIDRKFSLGSVLSRIFSGRYLPTPAIFAYISLIFVMPFFMLNLG